MMIHPLSDVQSDNIGEGTYIWQFCVVLPRAIIGANCNINSNVFIENDVIVGNNVTVKSGVQLWDGVRIGNNVFIGPNVTFTNDMFPRSMIRPAAFDSTIVEEWASIGANSTILPHLVVGKYSMVGAGSVVTKDIPPFTLWYGNPAKLKGYVTRIGEILSIDLIDQNGIKYCLVNQEPIRVI